MSRTVTRYVCLKKKKNQRPSPLFIITATANTLAIHHSYLQSFTSLLYHDNQKKIDQNRPWAVFIPTPEHTLCLLTVTRKRLASWITSLAPCLPTQRLQQHKRKTSVREGRHVRWASVAALEFLPRSHDKEDHYTGTKERALQCLNKDKMPLEHWARTVGLSNWDPPIRRRLCSRQPA